MSRQSSVKVVSSDADQGEQVIEGGVSSYVRSFQDISMFEFTPRNSQAQAMPRKRKHVSHANPEEVEVAFATLSTSC